MTREELLPIVTPYIKESSVYATSDGNVFTDFQSCDSYRRKLKLEYFEFTKNDLKKFEKTETQK